MIHSNLRQASIFCAFLHATRAECRRGAGADCPYRQVLVNDKKTGRQRVEVEHAAGWRLMMFRGQFNTRLIVEQVDWTVHGVAVQP